MPQEDKLYNVELSLTVTVHAKNRDEAEKAAYDEAANEIETVGDLHGVFEIVSAKETKED